MFEKIVFNLLLSVFLSFIGLGIYTIYFFMSMSEGVQL